MILTVVLWIIIGAALVAGGIVLAEKTYDRDGLGIILVAFGVVSILVGFIYCGMLAVDRNHERGIYEQYVSEQRDLAAALDSADEVVTAELYTKAIEFNKDLTYKQYLYNRGGYIPISGNYDWSAIPLVPIPQ